MEVDRATHTHTHKRTYIPQLSRDFAHFVPRGALPNRRYVCSTPLWELVQPDIAPISPFLLDYLRLRVDTHEKHVLPLPQTEHTARHDTRHVRLPSIFYHPSKRKTLNIDCSIVRYSWNRRCDNWENVTKPPSKIIRFLDASNIDLESRRCEIGFFIIRLRGRY